MSKDNKSKQLQTAQRQNGDNQMTFVKDTNFNYLLSKTEKICTALYMVSDLLEDKEPIKFGIKDSSIKMLTNVCNIVFSKNLYSDANIAGMSILEARSLLNLIYRSGNMSEMNYGVIVQEIDNILDLLSEIKEANSINSTDSEIPLVDPGFFAVDPVRQETIDQDQIIKERLDNIKDIYKGHKGQANRNVLYNNYSKFSSRTSDNSQMLGTSISTTKRQLNKGNSDRREKIVTLIKKNKKVSIKDIAAEIPDISEKTLQRELLSMVKEGLVKKEGERRWSQYYI